MRYARFRALDCANKRILQGKRHWTIAIQLNLLFGKARS
jgi:hypothetical protein